MNFFILLYILAIVSCTVFVLIVIWRAMRAHERLADAAWKLIQLQYPPKEKTPAFPFTNTKISKPPMASFPTPVGPKPPI